MSLHEHISGTLLTTLGAAGTAVVTTASGEGPLTVGAVTAIATAVVGALAWVEKRIDSKIATYKTQNEVQHRQIQNSVQAHNAQVIQSINHLRELLAITGAVPNLTPEPIRLNPETLPTEGDQNVP